jgi:hypothetical protein
VQLLQMVEMYSSRNRHDQGGDLGMSTQPRGASLGFDWNNDDAQSAKVAGMGSSMDT